MPSSGLIVLARVKPEYQASLRIAINRIGNDINGKRRVGGEPHIDFPRSRTIHFARLVLLADPDCGPNRERLLLVTDYEGSWYSHVRELFSLTSDPKAIWGSLEGYPGPYGFADFIRRHTVEPQAYYIAFREVSLDKIRTLIKLQGQSNPPLVERSSTSVTSTALHNLEGLMRLPLLSLTALRIVAQRGPLHALLAARRVNATLDRVGWIYLFNRLTLNSFPPPAHRHSSAPVDTTADCTAESLEDEAVPKKDWEGVPSEDLVAQNQLTLVSVVRPDLLPQLKAVLDVIDLYARHLAEQGSLVGISTIHTVRWVLLDGGKRLLMASNYDGTWENYIDEFAELILSGLDAIWESSYGFPELGAQDIVAFKHFLRCHQAPANCFYSAYPRETVQNILNGLQIDQDWASEL